MYVRCTKKDEWKERKIKRKTKRGTKKLLENKKKKTEGEDGYNLRKMGKCKRKKASPMSTVFVEKSLSYAEPSPRCMEATGPSPAPAASRPHRCTLFLWVVFWYNGNYVWVSKLVCFLQDFQLKFCIRFSQLLCTPRVLPVFFLKSLKECKSVNKYVSWVGMFDIVTRPRAERPKNCCLFSSREEIFLSLP